MNSIHTYPEHLCNRDHTNTSCETEITASKAILEREEIVSSIMHSIFECRN